MSPGFPAVTATALAARVLCDAAIEPDADLARVCLGEIANIVAGQAKALLAGTPLHFSLSAPAFDQKIASRSVPCVAMHFDCDLGEFVVLLFGRTDPDT
jgi:CheY-specific phosphatase CheX